MGNILSIVGQEQHNSQTRSLRIGAQVTSVRLEAMFWSTLEEIAARENISVGRLLSLLHEEARDIQTESKNFSSLLRCVCLTYIRQVAANAKDELSGPLKCAGVETPFLSDSPRS